MDKKIVEFLSKHHVLTLATSQNNIPWCANCFYAFDSENLNLVFTSDTTTRHIIEAQEQPQVACSIVLETNVVGKIQGIQMQGKLIKPEGEVYEAAQNRYLKRFPFAALMNTTLWVLEPEYIKMTDNRLGFGKKLIWDINNLDNK
jgi:uncharacterized protein YhbP (UPF0306 family)